MDKAHVLDLLFRDRCVSVSSYKKEVIDEVYAMLDKYTFNVSSSGKVWTICLCPGKEKNYEEIRAMIFPATRARTKSR